LDMVVPETFPCAPLDAVLSERACQNNQLGVLAEEQAGVVGYIAKGLTCICPIKKLDRADAPELPPVHDRLGMPIRQKEPEQPKTGRPLSKGRRKKRKGKIMPKATAPKQEVSGEPFIPDELVPGEVDRIEKNFQTKREILGIASGFVDLDKLTGGFQDADLILIAARPSMGKTALGLNIGFNAAKGYQVPTLLSDLPIHDLLDALIYRRKETENGSRKSQAPVAPGQQGLRFLRLPLIRTYGSMTRKVPDRRMFYKASLCPAFLPSLRLPMFWVPVPEILSWGKHVDSGGLP